MLLNFSENKLTTLFSCCIFRGLFLYMRVLFFEVIPHTLLGEGLVIAQFTSKPLVPQWRGDLLIRTAHMIKTSRRLVLGVVTEHCKVTKI